MDPKSSMDEPPPSSLPVPVPVPPPLPSQPVAKKARITAINCSSSSRSSSCNNGSTSVKRCDATKTEEQPSDWVTTTIVTNKDEAEGIDRALEEKYAESNILHYEALELQKTLSLLQSSMQHSAHDKVGLGPDVTNTSNTNTHQPLDKEQEAKSRLNDVVQSRQRVQDKLERLRERKSFLDFERACLNVCVIDPATTANEKGATAADSATEEMATAATRLRLVPRPAGYAKPLGEALLHARAQGFFPLSELVIFLHLLLPDVVDEPIPKSDFKPSAVASTSTTTTAKAYDTTATAAATAAIASAMTYIEPLLQYIGSTNNVGTTDAAASASAPLQSVRLLDYDQHLIRDRNVKDAMMESILAAICANPGIVNVHYAWSHHSLSARTLSAFLTKKAPSLHSLTVDFGRRRYSDDNDRALLGVALATLATGGILQSLEIQGMERAEEEPTLSILTQMRVAGSSSNIHSPLALMELKLNWEREVPQVCCEALAALLHCTMGLEHLELSNGRFDGSKLLVILSGLAHTKGDARYPFVTISKFSFCGCYFDEEGTRALTDFMQTKIFIDKDHANESMFSSSCLRELHFDVEEEEMFDSCETGLTIAQLLQMQPSSPLGYDDPQGLTEASDIAGHQEQPLYYSTVGSQIQTISLSQFSDYGDGFFTPLIEAPERVEMLTRLKIRNLDEGACRGLRQCVSKVPSIREVHLTYFTHYVECSSILLDMFREHSSVCSFACDDRHQHSPDRHPPFTAPQWRLVEAYCQRNLYLNRHYGRLDAADKNDGDTDDRKIDRMDKMLNPAFHQAVAHVPNRKSHVFIHDLVTCGQSIGYD